MSTTISTNNIVFTDGSLQGTAPLPIGFGQTWQNMTASRSASTNYINTSTKPIMVSVICGSTGSSSYCDVRLLIDGLVVQRFNTDPDATYIFLTLSGIVRPNSVYRVEVTNAPISSWNELR